MTRSEKLFQEAQQHILGGVNSPVRAFRSVGGTPVFFKKAHGAELVDEENKSYIDYVCSWGAVILGHADTRITIALQEAVANGLGFGAPTAIETEMAKMIKQLVPSIEKVRMVNSGTEATLSALRLARGYTGRDKIIKFIGCYHGHVDSFLIEAGSGALTLGNPTSAGIPQSIVQDTLIADFNDLASVEQLFEAHGDDIAGIIIEPIAGNMNCVPATQAFLNGLRELCDQYKSVLIFDEVMTGFRVAKGGAQSLYNIKPDLTALGKVIGGGMPVGAFGGRDDIMSHLAPLGPVYQAGTLSGNPIAMTAGLTALQLINNTPDFYDKLNQKTQALTQGIVELAAAANIPMRQQAIGGMFGLFFSKQGNITSYEQVMQCDSKFFKQFFNAMLAKGIYLAPSAFEAGFITLSHKQSHLDATLQAAEQVFTELKKN